MKARFNPEKKVEIVEQEATFTVEMTPEEVMMLTNILGKFIYGGDTHGLWNDFDAALDDAGISRKRARINVLGPGRVETDAGTLYYKG